MLTWYHKHKRDLPWRRTIDPYKIWISEIMLQQTTVAAVIDYYHRFLKRFPDIQTLAQAREEQVLALWSGLGYYSRAKNLHRAAQIIVQEHEGKFPRDPDKIALLPGIGRYTLGAIASIAFDQPLPLVDGNVIRVYARLFALKGSPKESHFQKKIWLLAEEWIPEKTPGDFNQALMELGATICGPQNPMCLLCPVQKFCQGRLLGPEGFPERKKQPETKLLKRIALVIENEGKILLQRSEDHRWMKGLWQLPGLLSENGEKPEILLKGLLKELGLSPAKKTKALKPCTHSITHHKITIFPFLLSNFRGNLKTKGPARQEWILALKIGEIPLPSADRKILWSLFQK